jgi:hypothetical protein
MQRTNAKIKSPATLKRAVLLYSTLFTSLLFLVLWLPSDGWGYIVLKGLLGVILFALFYRATFNYPEITLGAFLAISGGIFLAWWFLSGSYLGFILGFIWLLWIASKYRFIDKISTKQSAHLGI